MNVEIDHAPRTPLIKRFGSHLTYGGLAVGVLIVLGWSVWSAVELAREAVRRSTCSCRLTQIGLGLQNYAASGGWFPAAYSLYNAKPAAKLATSSSCRCSRSRRFTAVIACKSLGTALSIGS